MQSCIRHFFVVFHEFDLGSSIRQSRILAEGLPLAGNGKFPFYQIFLRLSFAGAPACGKRQIPVLSNIFAFIICRGSRLRETANSHRTKRLAVFFSPVGRKDLLSFFLPSKERLVVIFSKYCLTRKLPLLRQA